jgi:1,2-phenylacetyl-CoA epoxidase catalytic subunit
MSMQPDTNEILCLADTKWLLGHWHMAVMPNGKTFDDFTAIAALMQEELGHARALFGIVESLEPRRASLEHERTPAEIHSMVTLNVAPASWADYVSSVLLVDYATWEMLVSFEHGPILPESLIAKIGQEERFHQLACIGWLKSFSEGDRAALRESFAGRYADILRWFGPPSEVAQTASGEGILAAASPRSRFISAAKETFSELVPPNALQPALTWDDWDGSRRCPRGAAIPAQMWEMLIPTNEDARIARRTRETSDQDGFYATG